MDFLQQVIDFLTRIFVTAGISVGGENIPFMVIILLGIGMFLTLRLGFIQVTRLGHGAAVASGKYEWRLLTSAGLKARYIATIGINPPGGVRPVPKKSWVGDHLGAGRDPRR